ncbi:DNA polymerase ligase N-terminal domain-containing protein [Nocardiopsis xinjiangensis]|uniref:DNA polymerase ligase N-terminal domain-containing protein n=1 Tax=Nocardiopsis xinjiangensis TaxID=124285 RepID=UPI00034B1DA8|nr:DNA polymerase ligase N-terminal domain-containing protein [Nocardiopsis xinjiangensis]
MADKSEGDQLSDYHRRRDLERTEEPRGRSHRSKESQGPVFVVQHHVATADHYDLRLEVDGVLRSWAVPKGVSTDPRDKRLAMPTEDHPLDYAGFEGTIPGGEYGGGTVQIWDRGRYANTTRKDGRELSMAEGLEKGHVSVRLSGEKLSGGYALTRIRADGDGAWLLMKEKDEQADARRDPVSTQTESVAGGREPGEIAEQDGRTLRGRSVEGDGTS